MKIYIHGDHSGWHCGSKAVIQYLKKIIVDGGHVLSTFTDADCVIINGEGSIHNNRTEKLKFGEKALRSNKQVHLVNTVWEKMDDPYIDIINQFNSVTVRELSSYNNIKNIRSDVNICIDLSLFHGSCPEKTNPQDIVYGGTWKYDKKLHNYIKSLNLNTLDIKQFNDWSQYLSALSRCKLVYTGYHHSVIACCKLNIPFIPYRGNTNKVSGIIEMAGARIPVADNINDFIKYVNNPVPIEEYNKLFAFINKQKPFKLQDIGL